MNGRKTRIAFLSLFVSLLALSAHAQAGSGTGGGGGKRRANAGAAQTQQVGKQIACPGQQELVKIPELVSANGRLRATVTVDSEKQRISFRYPALDSAGNPMQPGEPGAFQACFEQWVRAFRSPDATPPFPVAKEGSYLDPNAGPTLRARVGDVIELAFLNKIDPSNFGASIDRGDAGDCDQSAGPNGPIYPKAANDEYPDCFHGSTTANIHFHGTHTNPNTTGDNVFVEIVSYKRLKDEAAPDVAKFRNALFDAFFNRCEAVLLKSQHSQFPTSWNDLPPLWTAEQKRLLQKYDQLPGIGKKLWPVDERQLRQGAWPQYYLGAFPYCFRLPDYPETTTQAAAPATAANVSTAQPHTHGAGTAELGAENDFNQGAVSPALIMGQSPGIHWYHAHKHGSTTIDVSNGMTGAFVIEGKYDDQISAYYDPQSKLGPDGWTRQQPVMVINQIGVSPNLMSGGPGTGQDKGPDFSVNGRMNPLLSIAPGDVKMLRMVNTSSRATAWFLGPPAGYHWKQIAQDGVQFDQYNWDNRNNDKPFFLAPGERADLLVSAPAAACTSTVAKACQSPVQVNIMVDPTDLIPAISGFNVYPLNLFTFNLKGTAINPPLKIMPTAPDFPSFLGDIADSDVKATRLIEFASTPPPAAHTIDGHKFNGEVGEVVLLNTVEEWKVTNATTGPNIAHPFHIHINPFQIPEVFSPNETIAGTTTPKYVTALPTQAGQCYLDPDDPSTWRPQNYNATTQKCDFVVPQKNPKHMIWWDTFPIPSGMAGAKKDGTAVIVPGYFKMRSRFVDFAGYYVIHCHILAHEDRGMMTVVEVAPIISPYSHH